MLARYALTALATLVPLGGDAAAQLCTRTDFGAPPVAGQTRNPNEVHCYWFSGTAGDVVRLSRWYDPNRINCVVEVLNPSRARLAFMSPAVRHLDFTLTQSGAHRLMVRDDDLRHAGRYALSIQRLNAPQRCRHLCYSPQPARGAITSTGETACFTFTARKDASVRISKSWSPSRINLVAEVFDAAGKSRLVINARTLEGTFKPPASGHYLLLVYDDDVTHAGPYTVRLTCLARECGCVASWRNHGEGWPGTNGKVPELSVDQPPKLGQRFVLTVGNSSGVPGTPAALLLAGHAASVKTRFGGTLHIDPVTVIQPIVLPAGGLTVPFDIEDQPDLLCDLCVHAQTVVVDRNASHGLAFSRGLELIFGR